MPNRVAVLDLGTNTFHLHIAEKNGEGFKTLCHIQHATRLGEDGMPGGNIKPEAFERGIASLKKFKQSLDEFAPDSVMAIGTSALRSAGNGSVFIEQVKQEPGIHIIAIDGDQEADYIFKGVRWTGVLARTVSLIVDIGGGSIEFIVANEERIYWKHSYEIGAARLMRQFHRSDPIPMDDIRALETTLDHILADVFTEAKRYGVENIIGSSGSFETFAELAELQKGNSFDLETIKSYRFNHAELMYQLDYLIHSTHAVRAANPNILPVRVDMIVVASAVTRYLMQKLDIRQVILSVYSLKEGVMAELLG